MRRFAAALLIAAATLLPAQAAVAAPASFSSTVATGSTCAGVPGGAPTAALPLTTSACAGAAGQRFAFSQVSTDVYTIATLTAGSCVDISGRSTADNANGVYRPGHNGFFKSPDGTQLTVPSGEPAS